MSAKTWLQKLELNYGFQNVCQNQRHEAAELGDKDRVSVRRLKYVHCLTGNIAFMLLACVDCTARLTLTPADVAVIYVMYTRWPSICIILNFAYS